RFGLSMHDSRQVRRYALASLILVFMLPSTQFVLAAEGTEAKRAPAESRSAKGSPGLVEERPAGGHHVETPQGFMVPYTAIIPGTEIEFEMVPVPGGEFTMGSPEDEEGRGETDLPATRVKLPPYWIGRYEVTWNEYWKFMELNDDFAKLEALETMINEDG